MTDSANAISTRNAEVVRRHLRVFESKYVSQLEELVAEDVLVHGAGQPGIKSYRLQNGRIVEFRGETDLYGLLR